MEAWAIDSRLMKMQLITKLWEEREIISVSLCFSQKCSAAMSLVIVKLKVNFLHEQRRCCYLACEKSCSF